MGTQPIPSVLYPTRLMRKIEAQTIQAIRRALRSPEPFFWSHGNMTVSTESVGILHTPSFNRWVYVSLFGERIAQFEPLTGRVTFYDRGYRSATTKARLNVLMAAFCPGTGAGIYQKAHVWYDGDNTLWGGEITLPYRLDADNQTLLMAEKLA